LLIAVLVLGVPALSVLVWRKLRALEQAQRQLADRLRALEESKWPERAQSNQPGAQPPPAAKPGLPEQDSPDPKRPPGWWQAERQELLHDIVRDIAGLMPGPEKPGLGTVEVNLPLPSAATAEAGLPAAGTSGTTEAEPWARPSPTAPATTGFADTSRPARPGQDEAGVCLESEWNESRGQAFTAALELRGLTHRSSGGLVAVEMGLGAADVLVFPAARTDVRGVTFNKYFDVTGKGRALALVRPARIHASQLGGGKTLEEVPAYEVTRGEVRLE
jgi:hypothetical protein